MSKRVKFILITWIGKDVGVMHRAKVTNDKSLIKQVLLVSFYMTTYYWLSFFLFKILTKFHYVLNKFILLRIMRLNSNWKAKRKLMKIILKKNSQK